MRTKNELNSFLKITKNINSTEIKYICHIYHNYFTGNECNKKINKI